MSIHESRRAPGARPRFSVLIPTRDRPAYVKNALESVLEQSFGDFEVIVCDNYKNRSCQTEVEAFGDPRVRYIKPPTPLAMHDNWEFAIDEARGDYVLVVIDKTLLRLNALERLQAATLSHPAEVYSWTSDAYYLTHEKEDDVGQGYLVPVRAVGEPFYVDCKQEMAARLSFQDRIGSEGPSYVYGKICFGAFSRKIINQIKERLGRVCPLISPDYTSKTSALLCTDRLVDLNSSCAVHLNTQISNGMLFSQNSAHARRFLAEAGLSEREFKELPIPNVFCSVHNICAYDWRIMDLANPGYDYKSQGLDLAGVYVQTQLDLDSVKVWASDDEQRMMLGHMKAFLDAAPVELRERISASLAAMTRVDVGIEGVEEVSKLSALKRALRRAYKGARRFRPSALSAGQSDRKNHNAPSDPLTGAPQTVRLVGPTVNGFPSFRTTIAALRYADSELYSYPLPQPAPI